MEEEIRKAAIMEYLKETSPKEIYTKLHRFEEVVLQVVEAVPDGRRGMVQGIFQGSQIAGQGNPSGAEGIDSWYTETTGRATVRPGGYLGH